MRVLAMLYTDLYRLGGQRGGAALLRAYMKHPSFRYVVLFRLARHFARQRGPLARLASIYYRVRLGQCSRRFGIQIPYTTEIGPGLYLPHFGLLVVNPGTRIGENVNLSHGVTLGHVHRGKRAGVPTIGNGVWIGPNAIVVGGITVGDNALIAPGALVNFDVPADAVVVGNPGQIVSSGGAEGYVRFKHQEAAGGAAPVPAAR